MAERSVKIAIHFEIDDGSEVETVWARALGDDRYVIDNIPFYAKGLSLGDTVIADATAELPVFSTVVSSGGHSTLRVLAWKTDDLERICARFTEIGCDHERSDTPGLIAVDVPTHVPWSRVQALLRMLVDEKAIDYEEAAISRHHVP